MPTTTKVTAALMRRSVYAEGDWGENPLQACPDGCIQSSFKGHHYASDDMPRLDHYTRKVFAGFDPALPSSFTPRWAAGVTQVGSPVFKYIHLVDEGRIYKGKIFELTLGGSKTIYVAFEVANFTGSGQTTIAPSGAKRCAGHHAYSMKYNGKDMLLFVDVAG